MKTVIFLVFALFLSIVSTAQIDKEALSLEVSKVEDANLVELKKLIWKRHSKIFVDGAEKLNLITEFSFDESGELQTNVVDAQTDVKQKRGLRGAAQKNAIEDKMQYVEKAGQLALAYTFMTKGQLLDFFSNATVTEENGNYIAIAENVYVKGDKVTFVINKESKQFISKQFNSFVGADAISGEIIYADLSNGVHYGKTSNLDMPAKKLKIKAENKDYTARL
jgi:hypothetical protein